MSFRRSVLVALAVLICPVVAAGQQPDVPVSPGFEPFPIESHWLVSGTVGSDFAGTAEDPGVNFAGTAGYLWRGVFGGEFQANFSPAFQMDEGLAPAFLDGSLAINSYMMNVIGAAPLMAGGQFQPYVSGGPGWFTLRGDPMEGDGDLQLDRTETGWNLGFGAMGFLGQLGLRTDVRYFSVGGDEFSGVDGNVLRARHGLIVDDQESSLDVNLLSGISFWRASIGAALRF